MKQSVTKHVHEEFEVRENEQDEGIKLLRQERHFPGIELCYVKIAGTQCSVVNYSSFGIVVECASNLVCKEALYDVPFIYDQVEIVQLHIQQIRRESQGNNIDLIAFEIIGEPINQHKIMAVETARRVIQQQHEYVQSNQSVPVEVKAQVYEIADWLEHLMS